jgi:endonuclease I
MKHHRLIFVRKEESSRSNCHYNHLMELTSKKACHNHNDFTNPGQEGREKGRGFA